MEVPESRDWKPVKLLGSLKPGSTQSSIAEYMEVKGRMFKDVELVSKIFQNLREALFLHWAISNERDLGLVIKMVYLSLYYAIRHFQFLTKITR